MWAVTPVVVGTLVETVEIIGVPVPVHPLPLPLPPPAVVMHHSHYQFMAQGVLPHPAAAEAEAEAAADPPAKAGVVEDVIEVNTWNAAQFASQILCFLRDCSPSNWHQIIVSSPVPENERRHVISAINRLISPMKLIPYFFCMESMRHEPGCKRISFFVNMCTVPLKELCERHLTVPYASGSLHEITLTLRLSKKIFNLSDALKEIVSRRLENENKFLDLSYINDIPEVKELLYDPADNWHILDGLLWMAKRVAPGLTALSLAGNGIKALGPLERFLCHSNWKALRTLDLSDNEIKKSRGVFLPPTLQISEVYLDRNPICQSVERASYVRDLKVTFPNLSKLDGTYLNTTAGIPYWKPNFIVDSTDDVGELADQFIEHFFTLYDDSNRMKLHGLYHENACFSLSCYFFGRRSAASIARFSAYEGKARNLLRKSSWKALTCGSEKILDKLSNLPSTRHDPYTFTVDLMVHTPKMTVLTVTGVFRDTSAEKPSHLYFSRSFVLVGRGNGEYQITNDSLYISNATMQQVEEAFQFLGPPKEIKKNQSNLSECEKEKMIKTVQQLTNMSAELSQKCLEDTDWDLKKSLQTVILECKTGIRHSK